MSEQELSAETPAIDWRIKTGVALFGLSIVAPLLGIPLVAALNVSATMTASISGALLMMGEGLGIVAVAVMGKSGYAFIKSRALGFLKQHGPPQEVGRLRYNIGLVVFSIPLLYGWLSPYGTGLIPSLASNPFPYAIGGDLLLLVSLFVLGGDFWDKIRALFVYSDKVCPQKMQAAEPK